MLGGVVVAAEVARELELTHQWDIREAVRGCRAIPHVHLLVRDYGEQKERLCMIPRSVLQFFLQLDLR